MSAANELGASLERHTASVLDGQRVKQSGGGKFWKLDVRAKALKFMVSCKATDRGRRHAVPSIKITKELILEARAATHGGTGTGEGYDWAIVGEVEGIRVFVCELDAAVDRFTAAPGEAPRIAPSKAQDRLARARRSIGAR